MVRCQRDDGTIEHCTKLWTEMLNAMVGDHNQNNILARNFSVEQIKIL